MSYLKVNLRHSRIIKPAVLFLLCGLLTACHKHQGNLDLPVLDAIGGDFTLPSTLDRELSLSEYQGQVVLLNFGFTHCPDVCPMLLNRLAKLTKHLHKDYAIGADQVKILFISVDPERDTLEHLKQYLAFFNADFIGLAGSLQQTKKIARQYAAFYQKQPDQTAEDYQVIHNDRIFLIDKRGRLRALYAQYDADKKITDAIANLVHTKL